jgi:hypothetical protein
MIDLTPTFEMTSLSARCCRSVRLLAGVYASAVASNGGARPRSTVEARARVPLNLEEHSVCSQRFQPALMLVGRARSERSPATPRDLTAWSPIDGTCAPPTADLRACYAPS